MDIFCVFVTKCRYFWIWIKQKISCYAIYRVFSIISSLCLGFNQKPVLVVLVSARNQYWLFLLQSETSIGCLKFNKKPVLVDKTRLLTTGGKLIGWDWSGEYSIFISILKYSWISLSQTLKTHFQRYIKAKNMVHLYSNLTSFA